MKANIFAFFNNFALIASTPLLILVIKVLNAVIKSDYQPNPTLPEIKFTSFECVKHLFNGKNTFINQAFDD